MNNENLKRGNPDTQFKSGREAVENGRKGGKKAAENRKKRNELKQTMIDMLNAEYPDGKGNKHTGIELIVIELFKAATDSKSRNYNRSLEQLLAVAGFDKSEEEKKRIKNALILQAQEIEINKKKMEKMDEEWI